MSGKKTMNKSTIPKEFVKFYNLLMQGAPEGFSPYFFVVDKSDKAPHLARGAWSKDKNKKTAEQALKLIKRGFNIGIAGMDDNLIILDIDDEDAIDPATIVPTLSVRSRSRTGTHNFYFIDDTNDKRNIAVPDVGELRAQHQYVVAAGSYAITDPDTVPDSARELAGFYTVENAVSPAHITFNQLPIIFRKQYIFNYLIPSIKDKFADMARIFDDEPVHAGEQKSKSGLFDLEVPDVIHAPRDGRNFESPLHGSKNGKNSTYSNGWMHCFRCGVSHNATTLLAVMAGISTCEKAGFGHKYSASGRSSIDMTDGGTVYKIWDFARRNGYLPKNDPPPNVALRYFVVETGICNAEDIEDGWRIPSYAYAEGRRLLRANL